MGAVMCTMRQREGTRTMAKVGCHALFGTGLAMHLLWARQGRKAEKPSNGDTADGDGADGDGADGDGDDGDGDDGGSGPATPAINGGGTPARQERISVNVGETPRRPQDGGTPTTSKKGVE